MEWLSPDFEAIRDYLEHKLNWGSQKFNSMLGPLEKHLLQQKGKQKQTTLDSFVLKTISPPKNPRVKKAVDRFSSIKQIRPEDVVIDSKHIRIPKKKGRRGKRK